MLKQICILAVLLLTGAAAHAAKVPFTLVTPNQNEPTCDTATPPKCTSTALTDLKSIKVEWGTCAGTAPNYSFGTLQASITILTSAVGVELKGFIYPSGLQRACVRAYAINADDVSSNSSGVAVADKLLPSPGKPVTLDKPVILSFHQ